MKWIARGLAVVLLLLVVALVVGFFLVDSITRRGIEYGSSYAMGVDTELASANVGLFTGELVMDELHVANPPGFDRDFFLTLDHGLVQVGLGSLMQDTVEVPQIELTGLVLNLERKEGRSNYNVILENLQRLSDPDAPPSEEGKQFIVRELVIRDITVFATVPPSSEQIEVKVPAIELTDVGSETGGGVLLSELSGIVLTAVLKAVVKQAGDVLPAMVLGGLQEGLAGVGDLGKFGMQTLGQGAEVLQDVTGRAAEQAGDAARKAGEAARGAAEGAKKVGEEAGRALEGIGNLFGGEKEESETPPDDEN